MKHRLERGKQNQPNINDVKTLRDWKCRLVFLYADGPMIAGCYR